MKQQLLSLARVAGVFNVARRVTAKRLRILAYHGLWITPGFQYGDRLFMPPALFEQRMRSIKKSGYPVLPLGEAVNALAAGNLPDNAVVITIDDGWRSTYTHMLPILEELGLPATVYVTTWYVQNQAPVINKALDYALQRAKVERFTWRMQDGMTQDIRLGTPAEREAVSLFLYQDISALTSLDDRQGKLRELCGLIDVPTEPWWSNGQFHLMTFPEIADASRRGIDIQLHTHRHCGISDNIDRLEAELAENRQFLSTVCPPEDLEHFCYPGGYYHNDAGRILAKNGIRSATTCDAGLNSYGANLLLLRRFLDGRSVPQAEFDAFLAGALDLYSEFAGRLRGA